MEENKMTVAQLIAALSRCTPTAVVEIVVKQHNKVYGRHLPLITTFEKDGYEFWIKNVESHVDLYVHLPTPAIISKFPE